eukprot:COSAG06_NODE_1871_length_8166_cov_129.883228_1_plen_68_part_00
MIECIAPVFFFFFLSSVQLDPEMATMHGRWLLSTAVRGGGPADVRIAQPITCQGAAEAKAHYTKLYK